MPKNMHKPITVSDLGSLKWLLLCKGISSAQTPACMGEPEGCALKLIHGAIYTVKHAQALFRLPADLSLRCKCSENGMFNAT